MLPLKLLFASTLVVGAVTAASAQETTAPLIWKVQADSAPYFTSTSNGVRGMYLNPTENGSLLVASRDDGNFVRRLDPATGELKDPPTIPTTGYLTGATFAINKVVVSDDGVVYVTSLGVQTGVEQHFRIYRHADEFSQETIAADIRTEAGTGIGFRLGDDVDIIGSGNDTKILVAGASGGGVHLFTTTDNGLTFTRTQLTGTPSFGTATPHIAWDPDVPNRFYYRGAGGEISQAYDISGSAATAVDGATLPGTAVTEAGYGPFDIGQFNGVKSFALGIGNSSATTVGKLHKIYRLEEPMHQYDWFATFAWYSGGAKANGNAAGDVYIDSENNEVYFLYTNNTIAKYGLPGASVGEWNRY